MQLHALQERLQVALKESEDLQQELLQAREQALSLQAHAEGLQQVSWVFKYVIA